MTWHLRASGPALPPAVIDAKKTESIAICKRNQRDRSACGKLADQRVGWNSMNGGQPNTQNVAQRVGSTGATAFSAIAAGAVMSISKNASGRTAGVATERVLE